MIRTLGLVSALALATALGGCAMTASGSDMPPLPASATAPIQYVRDIHSYARPEIAHVRHVALDLAANFQTNTLSGTATLDIQGVPGATEVILDVRNLDIRTVTDASGAALQHSTGPSDPILGQALTVRFPALAAGATMRASQVWRMPGLSWVGTQVRVRIACPWLNI